MRGKDRKEEEEVRFGRARPLLVKTALNPPLKDPGYLCSLSSLGKGRLP